MEATFDGCDIIDTTNGYQSYIDRIIRIIKRLSKMISGESSGRKGFESRSWSNSISTLDFLSISEEEIPRSISWEIPNEMPLSIFWNISPFPTIGCKRFESMSHLDFHSISEERPLSIFWDKGPRQSLTALNNRRVYQAESRELFLLCLQLHLKATCRKGFELTSFLERRLCIFWDMKSSPFPTNVHPEDIAKKIKAFVKRETKINWEAVDVYAYGHSSAEQKLHYSGVTLIYTPRGRKDTMYIALLVDMFKRSRNCPPPSAIMLITGNIHYANTLHALWLLGHKIILVTPSEVDISVPLINSSVYTWSDMAKGTSTSQVQIKELPDDNNNWPWSNLVKREDFEATSSIQIIELSMRCMEFVSIDPSDTYLFIFWDIENCPIPKGVPAKAVLKNILKFVEGKIDWSCARMRAYADLSRIPGEVRESLEKSGVQLIHTPHEKKDAADEAIMIDLFMYSKLVPSPSSIMVITGDVDFATTLHAIDGFGHDIFLAIPSRPRIDVSKSLTSASKDYWYWSEVAYGIDLTGLKGQLEELLKSNGGQLRLGSLDAEYEKMFEKPLCLSDYKADNLVNLLNRMSYMISVEFSKKGKRVFGWRGFSETKGINQDLQER